MKGVAVIVVIRFSEQEARMKARSFLFYPVAGSGFLFLLFSFSVIFSSVYLDTAAWSKAFRYGKYFSDYYQSGFLLP